MSYKVAYCGVSRGLARDEGHPVVLYYGAVRRIPSHEFHEDSVAASEKYDAAFPGSLLDDREDCERIPNAPIEHFDTYDKETGDMLVLWRVPYRPKAGPPQDDATPPKRSGHRAAGDSRRLECAPLKTERLEVRTSGREEWD